MSLRDENKEFISYRNEATRSYIAFEKNENISHEQSEYIAKFFVPNLKKSYKKNLLCFFFLYEFFTVIVGRETCSFAEGP